MTVANTTTSTDEEEISAAAVFLRNHPTPPPNGASGRSGEACSFSAACMLACFPYTRPVPPLRITALRTATAPAGQPYNVCIADAALPYAYCNSCEAACFACCGALSPCHSLPIPVLSARCS